MNTIAEVAVPVSLSLDETFDYAVPRSLKSCQPGCRVLVPFGRQRLIGYVTALKDHSPYQNRLKTILKILDAGCPILDRRLMRLARLLRDNYFCSLAQAFDTVLPRAVRMGTNKEEAPVQTPVFCAPAVSGEMEERLKTLEKHKIVILEDIDGAKRWEFYKAGIRRALLEGKSACLLVPEFDRIPQVQEKCGLEGLVITSQGQSSKTRTAWFLARQNSPVFVIGTRSAVFAPLQNLGLIIIDDESHFAYRQQQVPNYHARDLALKIVQEEHARLILGNSVPSLEAFDISRRPDAVLVRLSERKGQAPALVDMKQEFRPKGRSKIISKALEFRLNEILEKQEKTLLFVDKKAFSTFLYCPKCKQTLHCSRCSSPLAFYRSTNSYVCPACHDKQEARDICPICSSAYVRHRGFGEEKVENELRRLFPGAKIAALTKQTPSLASYDIMLAGPQIFEAGRFDRDPFALVAVINADHTLARPDFRATEHAFEKFLKLSILSHREFVAQTNIPDHYIWDFLKRQDLLGFLSRELEERKALNLPPVSWLGCLTLRAKNESTAKASLQEALKTLRRKLGRKNKDVEVFDGQQASPFRLRSYYRYQILIKYRDIESLRKPLAGILKSRHPSIITFDPAVY